jgi:hypothetical protein
MATRGRTVTVWSHNKNKKGTVNCIKLHFEKTYGALQNKMAQPSTWQQEHVAKIRIKSQLGR